MKQIFRYTVVFLLISACSRNNYSSRTSINPKTTFVLGDKKHGAIMMYIKNLDSLPVRISERLGDSGERFVLQLDAGQTKQLNVGADQKIFISNTSLQRVVLKIRIKPTKNTGSLSMGYVNP